MRRSWRSGSCVSNKSLCRLFAPMRRSIVEIPLPYFRHIFSNGCRYVRAHCVSCPALWALLHHHGGRDAHAARGVCGDRHALVADAPLVLIAGVFTLFGGLAIVLLHNYWSGGALTVIITLLGWLTLIKAVLLLVFRPPDWSPCMAEFPRPIL